MSDIAIDDVAILQGDECIKNESTSVTISDDGIFKSIFIQNYISCDKVMASII